MYKPNNSNNKTFKHHMNREKGIPDTPFFQCYMLSPDDVSEDSPLVCIGFDSGITNTAFSYLELVQDEKTRAVRDFTYRESFYLKEELDALCYKIDKQFYIANKYQKLFSHMPVISLTYEVLPLTAINNASILEGVIDAQATTNLINAVAYSLNHPFHPVPATAIKYCLTGNGNATKEEMCLSAFAWTGDEMLLYNDHMADAFADCFYAFISRLKEDCVYYSLPVPEKFKHMTWNFKNMPAKP